MQLLKLKHSHSDKRRKNGTRPVVPLLVTKSRKYGAVQQEIALSRKRCWLLTGHSSSGKSRMLGRLHEAALDIWGGQPRITGRLLLSAVAPISAWHDQSEVMAWYTTRRAQHPDWPTWKGLGSHQRDQVLIDYCAAKRTVVLLDDAQRLTGRKAELAKRCLAEAKVGVVATTQLNRLPPALRLEFMRRDPQLIELQSDASYDLTGPLLWLVIAGAALAGAYEVALLVGGLKWLGRGRNAARQE